MYAQFMILCLKIYPLSVRKFRVVKWGILFVCNYLFFENIFNLKHHLWITRLN